MKLSQNESDSLLRKWKDESRLLDVIVNIGAVHGVMRGVLTDVEPEFIVVSGLLGQLRIMLNSASAFEYEEVQEGPQPAKDLYPEFVSGLHIRFDFGECLFAELDFVTIINKHSS